MENEEYSPAYFLHELEVLEGTSGYKNNMGSWKGTTLNFHLALVLTHILQSLQDRSLLGRDQSFHLDLLPY